MKVVFLLLFVSFLVVVAYPATLQCAEQESDSQKLLQTYQQVLVSLL